VHFIPAAGCLGREKSIGWCLGESSRAVERPEENDWRESGAEANDRGSGRATRSLASIYRARFAVGSGKGKNVMAKEAPGRARCGQFLQDVRALYFSFDFQFSRVVGSPSLPGRANCVPPPFFVSLFANDGAFDGNGGMRSTFPSQAVHARYSLLISILLTHFSVEAGT
jgi:hypothetical protein